MSASLPGSTPPTPPPLERVGPGLRVLVCGLKPSIYSAQRGIPFARPGNRFWPAAIEAGMVTRDRDPEHAFTHDRVGFTDVVARPTVAVAEIQKPEFVAGMRRVRRMAARYRPAVVCFVGLTGWRAAVDPRALPGTHPFGPVTAYLMPSTSGLNASSQHADFVAHFRAVVELASAVPRS